MDNDRVRVVFQWVGLEEVSGGCSSAQAVETYQEDTTARPMLTIRYLENEMQESYTQQA